MKRNTYSFIVSQLEAMVRDAEQAAAAYAESGDAGESQYQEGHAAGVRDSLAMIYQLDRDSENYMDTRDRFRM